MEHTILDKILKDWEVEEGYEMEEGVMEECPDDKGQDLEVGAVDSIDECIRTIACVHNCSGNLELPCKSLH